MILHIEFRVDADRWRVRVAETGFARDMPNRMGYGVRGRVVSMGEYPLLAGADAARVVPIYDATRFDPASTAMCLRFYTMLVHPEGRRGLARVLDLFDRYELTLVLPGYMEIDASLRQAFERELDTIGFVRSYSINGRERKLP